MSPSVSIAGRRTATYPWLPPTITAASEISGNKNHAHIRESEINQTTLPDFARNVTICFNRRSPHCHLAASLPDHHRISNQQAAKDACSGPAKGLPMQTLESAPAPNCTKERKKRGRPLQYELGSKAALSPMPVSFAFPMTGEFSASNRGRGLNDFKDDGPSNSIGSHFSHHAFIVNSGEDVASRISLLALDFQAISVLSGSGSISSVTIDMSDSGIETLKYEGIFDLLSLTGSFEPNKDGLVSGKLTVSLAIGGRVIQGPLAGSLVAAGPVKVVVASFCPPKTQKQKKGKEIADHS